MKSRTKLIILCLFIWQFFHLKMVMEFVSMYANGSKIFYFLLFALVISSIGNSVFNQKLLDKRYLQTLFVLAIVNCITCYYFRHQSIFISMVGWSSFIPMLFYPVLKSWKLSVEDLEYVILFLYCIILVCYVLQNILVFYKSFIFLLDIPESRFDSGQNRVRIYSDAILYLGAIFCWNKYLIHKDNLKLLLFIIGFLVIFLQGFRMLILGVVLTSMYLYFKINGFSKKLLIYLPITLLLIIGAIQLPFVKNKIDEIQERNVEQSLNNEDYVRVLGLTYFYNEHFINDAELITGSGMPLVRIVGSDAAAVADSKYKASDYSYEMSDLAAYKHFYTTDYGFLGLSIIAGIPFTLLFVFFLFRIIARKVEKQYLYIGGYVIICMFCFFTHYMICYHMNLFALVLVYTILDKVHNKYV